MRIGVYGLGYVGTVTAACLAEMGHEVVGVDVSDDKVAQIRAGATPIVEDQTEELVRTMVAAGRLKASTDPAAGVVDRDLSFICVGTPSDASGNLDASQVLRVSEQIGAVLAASPREHLIVLRSTVLPGTVTGQVAPKLEAAAGRALGEGYGLCFHPEFLREGSAVRDFREPPKIVIGASSPAAAEKLAVLYRGFSAPLFLTSIPVAEMVKYADNAFHALKVVFANEIGALCKGLGIDGQEVMRIFCEDRKLNISPYYLKPGFAYGGSCLPKDLRALLHLSRRLNVQAPLLAAVAPSNDAHIARAVEMVRATGKRRLALLGLSFKPGTDDLRESPLVELAERLLGKGHRIRIYDEGVSLARLRGGNKAYIEQRLPHISELLVTDLPALIAESEAIIIGAAHPGFPEAITQHAAGKPIIDLVRIFHPAATPPDYQGLCW